MIKNFRFWYKGIEVLMAQNGSLKRGLSDAEDKLCKMAKVDKPSSVGKASHANGIWSNGLLASMNDPELKIDEDEMIVIIKDKYPKAKHHYLIIAKEKIQNLKSLKPSHLSLLQHMKTKGKELADSLNSKAEIRLGYHAIPSMSQLHMHVISQDFDSPSLKTKKHWNSFTTEYFVSCDDVIERLEKGSVDFDHEHHSELLKSSLKCHVCKKEISTMPALKTHIKSHFST